MTRKVNNEEEMIKGIEFYQEFFQKSFGTYPRESPDNLIIVSQDEKIIGTFSLRDGSDGKTFEAEKYFDLKFLINDHRDSFIEIGRVAGDLVGCGAIFIGFFITYAVQHKKERILSIVMPSLATWLKRDLGLFPNVINSAKIMTEDIPKEYRPYFSQTPGPVVIAPLVKDWQENLQKVRMVIGKLNVQFEFF